MKRERFSTWIGLALCAVAAGVRGDADLEFFEKRVRPVLAENCYSCHGPEKRKGGLRLDHGDWILEGGETGPAVVPGDPGASRLVLGIRYDDVDFQMPPRGRLSEGAIADLEAWVAAGARWPDEPLPAAGVEASGDETIDIEGRKAAHWAWRPIERPELPEVRRSDWPRNAVDYFILAAMEEAGCEPAPEADRATLVRRLSFDLTGLPPSPEAVVAVVDDGDPGVLSRHVDGLLGTPAFGERWARHWLDLARYAETYGHEFDFPIPEAWRYRDYVIRAFNADIPYDQFIREQIAGDLLPRPRRNPDTGTNESILGTTFWWLSQGTHAPVDVRQDEAERVDNQIDVFGKTFLGLTLACARCHDHKFDAISTRDYYALAGYLQSSRRRMAYLDPEGQAAERMDRIAALGRRITDRLRTGAPAPETAGRWADLLLAAREWHRVIPAEGRRVSGDGLPVRERRGGRFGVEPEAGRLVWTDLKAGHLLGLEITVPAVGAYAGGLELEGLGQGAVVRVRLGDGVVVERVEVRADGGGVVRVTFDDRRLAAGRNRIVLDVLEDGADRDAGVAVRGWGLKPVDPELTAPAARRLAERIEAAKLDPATVERLAAAVISDEWRRPDHPMAVWTALADPWGEDSGERFGVERDAFLEAWRAGEAGVAKFRGESELIDDFASGTRDWARTGGAFPVEPVSGMAWAPGQGGRLVPDGVVHSGLSGVRAAGAIRSETFTLEHSNLYYRVSGEAVRIRLVVDGYFLDERSGLLFSGMIQNIGTGGRSVWWRQSGDLGRYQGHRVHIEVLDENPGGHVMLEEIRGSNAGPPPGDFNPLHGRLLEGGDVGTVEDLARAYARLWGEILEAQAKGAVDTFEADWWNAMWREGWVAPGDEAWARVAAEVRVLDGRAAAIDAEIPDPVRVLAMDDGSSEDEYVFIRGSYRNRGDTVPRRFLEALGGGARPVGEWGSGRLGLADALLSDENPLTARVMVNRVWQHLFGRGIVASPDDFGELGREPTHPELLDWLADWFRTEGGWSVKRLIRLLTDSAAYRMGSVAASRSCEEADPANALWHRMPVKRLEGEAIRDALLSVSGRLDRTLHGPSVPIHLTPFMTGRGRPASGPLDGDGRRTIYLEVRRNFLSPFLQAFDFPTPTTTVGGRSVSNVPAQALILMNDPFVVEQARLWAVRLLERIPGDGRAVESERVRRAFEEALAREATPDEVAAALGFLEAQRGRAGAGATDESVWTDLCHGIFNLKEFIFLR